MTENMVKVEIADGVGRVILCRPRKRNALTRGFLEELLRAAKSVRADESVRVATLEAEGPVFCAGMDLSEMEQRASEPNAAGEWAKDARVYRDFLEAWFHLPIPTVAVVQGAALAGGLGLILACDLVLAVENAFFSLPEPKRGITAAIVTPLLVYRVSAATAGVLLFSGEKLTAERALRCGLCHDVVAADQLEKRRVELLASILTGSRSALAMSKKTLIDCAAENLSQQWDSAMKTSADARQSEDAREGLAAFLEKRDPIWFPR
ncbi:MAG: enoyl-CoA hydratase/isomerase family protein [Planctomycetes bacterium]|nr:enoyl-CoA hydratase/isomerase family protein [Planctomycetota bacterium]